MSGWGDDDDAPKLKEGEVYAIVPCSVHAAYKSNRIPSQTDFLIEPSRLKPGSELLAPGALGVDFEIIEAGEFQRYYKRCASALSNQPVFRRCEVLAPGPPQVLAVDVFPIFACVQLYSGGVCAVSEAKDCCILVSKTSSPTRILQDALAKLKAKGLTPANARAWLLRTEGIAEAGAAAEGGPTPQTTRLLLAGKRFDAFLTSEERESSSCAIEIERRGEDGTWPLGDTTRAVRARAMWFAAAHPGIPHPLAKFFSLWPAAKLVNTPLTSLCDVKDATTGSWVAAEFTKIDSLLVPKKCKVTVCVLGEERPVAPSSPKAAAAPQPLLPAEAAAADGSSPSSSSSSSNSSSSSGGGELPTSRFVGVPFEDFSGMCAPPLTHTQPWRSALRPGSSVGLRLHLLKKKGAPAEGSDPASGYVVGWGKVVDMDFGSYPPGVIVELSDSRFGLPSAAAGNQRNLPASVPLRLTVALESSSLFPSQQPAVVGGGENARAAAAPQALPALAQGTLPVLTLSDCGFLSEKGDASPFKDLSGDSLEEAALAVVEEMEMRSSSGSGSSEHTPGIVGFTNIGNTCFMASILQCLAAVEPMTAYFTSPEMLREINYRNPWSTGGRLAMAWSALMRLMRGSNRGGALTPALLKDILAERFYQYAGFQQQDCSEFSSNLFNLISEDLLRSFPKEYNPDGIESRGRPDADIANETWAHNKRREDHIITDVFAGQFHQVLRCSTCASRSVKCDPFTTLNLSLPQAAYLKLVAMEPSLPLINTRLRLPMGSDITQDTITVAEGAAWFACYAGSPKTTAAFLPPAITNPARDDAVGAYAVSGFIAAAHSDCIFVRVLDPREKVTVPGFSTVFYPVPLGCSYVPLNLRCAWDDEQVGVKKKDKSLPDPFRHSQIMYEPYMLAFPPEGATNKTVLDLVWGVMERFMSPAYRALHTPEAPPYTVYATNAVDSTVKSGLAGLQAACAARKPVPLAYTDEPFLGTVDTCALVLEAYRPYAEWKSLHEFPTALREGRKLIAFKDNMAHPAEENDQDKINLHTLLRLSEEEESMSGREEVYCANCKDQREQTKKVRVWRLPPVLCISLTRFKFSQAYGYISCEKLKDPVAFPVTGLDMSPYILEGGETTVTAPAIAFAPTSQQLQQGGQPLPPIYDLFAVSHHSGEYQGGHYTAHIQNYATGQWHFMDDARVSPSSPADAVTSKAYIMFYRLRGTEGEAVRNFNAEWQAAHPV